MNRRKLTVTNEKNENKQKTPLDSDGFRRG